MADIKQHRILEQAAGRLERRRPRMPDVYMPASWPVGALTAITGWLWAWRRRRRFLRLLDLDDRMLRDIGVTREEIRRAARLPLGINAAVALRSEQGHRRRC